MPTMKKGAQVIKGSPANVVSLLVYLHVTLTFSLFPRQFVVERSMAFNPVIEWLKLTRERY